MYLDVFQFQIHSFLCISPTSIFVRREYYFTLCSGVLHNSSSCAAGHYILSARAIHTLHSFCGQPSLAMDLGTPQLWLEPKKSGFMGKICTPSYLHRERENHIKNSQKNPRSRHTYSKEIENYCIGRRNPQRATLRARLHTTPSPSSSCS